MTGFILGIFTTSIYLIVRNRWAWRIKKRWAREVLCWGMYQLQQGHEFDAKKYYNALATYDTMLWQFWSWQEEYFVEDPRRYARVKSGRPPIESDPEDGLPATLHLN